MGIYRDSVQIANDMHKTWRWERDITLMRYKCPVCKIALNKEEKLTSE